MRSPRQICTLLTLMLTLQMGVAASHPASVKEPVRDPAAFGKIGPINLAKTVPEAIGIALRLVRERRWHIVVHRSGLIEAVVPPTANSATAKISIVATQANEGRTSDIMIRSVSRSGVTRADMLRVKEFLAALQIADRETP